MLGGGGEALQAGELGEPRMGSESLGVGRSLSGWGSGRDLHPYGELLCPAVIFRKVPLNGVHPRAPEGDFHRGLNVHPQAAPEISSDN